LQIKFYTTASLEEGEIGEEESASLVEDAIRHGIVLQPASSQHVHTGTAELRLKDNAIAY
jgi:hypothetical protein